MDADGDDMSMADTIAGDDLGAAVPVGAAPPKTRRWLGLVFACAVGLVAIIAIALTSRQDDVSATAGGSSVDGAVSAPDNGEAGRLTSQQVEVKLLRDQLDRLAAQAGDPPVPAGCRSVQVVLLRQLVQAAERLANGKPRGKRAIDRAALSLLEQVTETHGHEPELNAYRAKAMLFGGRSDPEVVEAAGRAIEKCSNYATAHELIGRVHLIGGRSEAAYKHFAAATSHAPQFVRGHYHLGLSALSQHDHKLAIKHLSEAIRLAPDHHGALLARGQAGLLDGQHKVAIADLKKVTTADKEHALAWFLLGGTYEATGEAEQRQAAFCKAASLGHKASKPLCDEGQGVTAP